MPCSSKAGVNGNEKRHLVCVTGAGGFIGSWVVKELLHRGYHVRGTARDPADSKNSHLLALDGAAERLTPCRADVLDYGGLRAAFQGCHGVFHVASPVSNDPELVPAAVEGTRNVINAAADAGVRRVVFTSSYGAVHMDPNRSPDRHRGRRDVLERLRLLQTDRQPVLLREDDGGDGGDGGGGEEGPGAGGGGAGDDGGPRPAAADAQLQQRPRPQLPHRRQTVLRERRHRLHRRPRRRPRARPRLRVQQPRRARTPPLPLFRGRAAPLPARPAAPGPLPGLPRHRQVPRRRQADGAAVQVLEPEAQGPGPGVHSCEKKFVRDGDIPAAKRTPAAASSGAKAGTHVNCDTGFACRMQRNIDQFDDDWQLQLISKYCLLLLPN